MKVSNRHALPDFSCDPVSVQIIQTPRRGDIIHSYLDYYMVLPHKADHENPKEIITRVQSQINHSVGKRRYIEYIRRLVNISVLPMSLVLSSHDGMLAFGFPVRSEP